MHAEAGDVGYGTENGPRRPATALPLRANKRRAGPPPATQIRVANHQKLERLRF